MSGARLASKISTDSGRNAGGATRICAASQPVAQRQAIELAYFGGLTQQEIAERTATPLGTVKSRVRLGLLQLRRVLSGGLTEVDRPSGVGLRPSDAIVGRDPGIER